jgi:hypothetical protein
MTGRLQECSSSKGNGKGNDKTKLEGSMRSRLGRRASGKEVDEIIKRRVKVSRALKGKRITDAAGIVMMLEIVL